MKLRVLLNPARLFLWQLWLMEDLSRSGSHEIEFSLSKCKGSWPASVQLLFQLENVLYGARSRGASDPIDVSALRPFLRRDGPESAAYDAVINLSGQRETPPSLERWITPLFNGDPDELAAVSALIEGETVTVTLVDSANIAGISAHPSLADPAIISGSLNNIVSRTAELIARALDLPATPNSAQPLPSGITWNPPSAAGVTKHAVHTVVTKTQAMLRRLLHGGERWAIAWREAAGGSLLKMSSAKFRLLQDDGKRFYADPFVLQHHGVSYMFCEEFPFATGKGVISVLSRQTNGAWSAAVPVIEEPYHLSYPFIFEYEDKIWMIPESGENRTVDLYQSVGFPLNWRKHATLLSGIAGYDATLHHGNDGWWMFVTSRHRQSATSDNLMIYRAHSPMGPWHAHALNPVMIDSRHSRCAGAIVVEGGRAVRPAQDCSAIYGGAMALCEITALTPDRFEQNVIQRIHARKFGVHTYNCGGGLEVCDVFGFVSGVSALEIISSDAFGDITA